MPESLIARLERSKAIHPPKWLTTNTCYLTEMGSHAYGTNTESSDLDVYGFCIPPKDLIFPHLQGEIPGFGRQTQRFEQWQQHGIKDTDGKDREYDFQVFSIVKYFQLCMENNPNMLDSLFTARECVLHSTPVAELVRLRRRLFLHKGAKHKFMGYAYSQLHKIGLKKPQEGSKRVELIQKYGYDVKYATHLVRLVLQCEQLLTEGDMDLRRNNELLKAVRRGEWTEQRVRDWFAEKEPHMERLYEACTTLPHTPPEDKLRDLLLNCLEHHYGSLTNAVAQIGKAERVLADIRRALDTSGY
jgi:predicted nucleotidyltransferase